MKRCPSRCPSSSSRNSFGGLRGSVECTVRKQDFYKLFTARASHIDIPPTAREALCPLTVLVNESRVGSKAAPAGQDLRTVGWDRRDSG